MRIIAGEFKGRRLKTVKGMNTRPTADKVKGAIFNILGNKISGTKVLDLFAGTGNLSLEALSRGSDKVWLIEKNHNSVEVIRTNLKFLSDPSRAIVYKEDAFRFLKNNIDLKFDLIFLDPPYSQGMVDKALLQIIEHNMLTPTGVIVVETAVDESLAEDINPLEIRIIKEYGDTKIWFLQGKE